MTGIAPGGIIPSESVGTRSEAPASECRLRRSASSSDERPTGAEDPGSASV